MWIAELNLGEEEKSILVSSSAWATDEIMDAAMSLVGMDVPTGADTTSALVSGMTDIAQHGGYQFINVDACHWVLVDTT